MGTKKHCPSCDKLTNVKVIPAEQHIFFTPKTRNWWRSNKNVMSETKFHYFARRLKCLNCNSEWTSNEIPMADFTQLMDECEKLTVSNKNLKNMLDIADKAAIENEDLHKTIKELNTEQKETFDSLVQAEAELSELRSGLNVLKKNMFYTDLPSEDKGQSTEVIKSTEEMFEDILQELSEFDFDSIDLLKYSKLDQERMISGVKKINIILTTIAEENGIKLPS